MYVECTIHVPIFPDIEVKDLEVGLETLKLELYQQRSAVGVGDSDCDASPED